MQKQGRDGNLWKRPKNVQVEASPFRRLPSFFHVVLLSPPPFLCRLEFISNQRASRELQLLITFSFAFLHINDCRVFGGVFCRSGLKAPQSRVLPGGGGGGGETGQRRGSEPVQSPWTGPPEGGRWLGGIWDGWILAVGGTKGVHRLKVNVPYQHKNEHMSSAPPNYCHIEQFTHLI